MIMNNSSINDKFINNIIKQILYKFNININNNINKNKNIKKYNYNFFIFLLNCLVLFYLNLYIII